MDPHSFADPDQARHTHLALELEPDLEAGRLRLLVHYTLDRPVRGSFFLDCRDLEIAAIESDGAALAWSLDRSDPLLGQRLHLSDLPGVRQFSIALTTSPAAAALQWLKPEQTAGGRYPFLYSQCQPCSARTLFPCQDTPGVRFTYQAELRARRPLVAVMAAERLDQVSQGEVTRYRFRMPQPIPSYLFAFAVARLDFRPLGPRTGVFAEPELIDRAAWEFAENEDRLRAAEGLFGPYLWDRYDLLIMPAIFPYGGMENPRLTFLNSTYLQGDRSGSWLVAHELAHAWTGNLVTNATWEDFWLNEGPTTYAETRISEVVEGVEAAALRTAGRALRLRRTVERLGPESPATCLRQSLAGREPGESYSDIAYFKGLLFLRRLEELAGRPRFDAFLRDYISAFRFQSIDSERFLEFLERELPDVAAAAPAPRWIYEPGLPQEAAQVASRLHDEVQAAVEEYRRGRLPSPERVAGWIRGQRIVFLGLLLPSIPPADCAYFERLFAVNGTADGELLSRFCELAFQSGYQDPLPQYERFFASVGRYLFHQPVFRALARQAWSRPLARPLLERWRTRHHAQTVAAIERILEEAGL